MCLLACTLICTLTGCERGAGRDADSIHTLTLWHALRDEERARLNDDLKLIEAELNIKIRALSLPHDAFANKLQVAIPQGNGPDLMITAHDRIGDWAKTGLLEPISYWVAPRELDGYLAPALQAMTYHDQLYGLPLSCKSLALFYNPQLTPEPPQTLEEMIKIARELKARSQGRSGGASGSGSGGGSSDPSDGQPIDQSSKEKRIWGLAVPEIDSLYFHAPWLHAYGGRAFAEGKPELNSRAMRESVKRVRALREEGLIPPEVDGALSSALFKNGELAFLINGPWLVAELGDLKPERWSVAPLPRIEETGSPLTPYLSVEGVMISTHARDRALAWRVAQRLASSEHALKRLKRGEFVARSVDQSSVGDLPQWQRAFQAQLSSTIPMSNDPLMKALWRPMKIALELTLIRGDDSESTLKAAQESALKTLGEM